MAGGERVSAGQGSREKDPNTSNEFPRDAGRAEQPWQRTGFGGSEGSGTSVGQRPGWAGP